ncbi:hypothetical protein C3F09_10540 [candidate division GN15 bacterium]|uniref:Outer membrane protein beta-barrel domain-containing protein n=1 Tax=candidate division GN15 bacterium TaxID=2072418 RepID=A0A855X3U4_9BACT|nr:MAG: hypothetical protein C3F09_10540 [candidate division GN15 bacterium]
MVITGVLLSVAAGSTALAETGPTKLEQFRRGHQAGFRLGVWSNSGDLPISLDTSGVVQYQASVGNTSFYAEAYLGIRLMPQAMLEFTGGMVNRGAVTVQSGGYVYYGNISLYPLTVRLKLYPLGGLGMSFQPYVMGGGGVYFGKNNIQFSNDYFAAYAERSVTDFNVVFGGGIDWPIASKIALDVQAAYLPMTFSKGLFGARDYSGVAITVGIKYVLPSLKGKQSPRH